MFIAKKVAAITTVLVGTYYSITAAIAQPAGGLVTELETSGKLWLSVVETLVPIILVALILWAAILIAATKRNYVALASVIVGAIIISQYKLILGAAGVTIT